MSKQWVTIHEHKGYHIKNLNNAEKDDDLGYKVDSVELWSNSYPTVFDAIAAIDALVNGNERKNS